MRRAPAVSELQSSIRPRGAHWIDRPRSDAAGGKWWSMRADEILSGTPAGALILGPVWVGEGTLPDVVPEADYSA